MRVLVICEDPTNDEYVLRPIVERVFGDLGRPARVGVLRDPHISGAAQALDPALISQILNDYAMVDLFVLIVDRDCDRASHVAKATARQQQHPGRLLAVLAVQEVEVWALAPHRAALDARWADVRRECDPKERYFEPFIASRGWEAEPGRGRKAAMADLGAAWRGILKVCPEIAAFKESVRTWLEARGA